VQIATGLNVLKTRKHWDVMNFNPIIKPQKEFPLWDEYAKHFALTEDTIFTLYPFIYTNNKLTPDLLAHENTHLKQQEKIGVKEWVRQFLEEPAQRIKIEAEAYKKQIQSIKGKQQQWKCRQWASQTLSSALYGNIISYQEAYNILKI
jgi:hypothetical protein